MQRKKRFKELIDYFTHHSPDAETELEYGSPYELLVATILSARCTDKRVNIVTPALVEKFPTVEHMAAGSADEIFPYIKSVTFPNNKSKHLYGMARMLVDDFGSEVPSDTKDLQKLPGVGRKTANVISSVIFNQPSMAVDTHVFRVSKRLGLVNENAKTPLEVEKQLVKNIPEEHISVAHHWLILHGRYVCLARSPKCDWCKISYFCRYFEKHYG